MWRLLLVLPLLAACGGTTAADPEPEAGSDLPATYSFDLESSCGERALIGRYRVWVEDDEVIRVVPTGEERVPPLEDVPTLDDLEELVEDADAGAVVETERHADGWLTWVSIDHLPEAIDDEECYRVSNVEETEPGAADEAVVSCGGSGPGWPVSAMEGGIATETTAEEIEAALTRSEEEMGIDGPFLGERTWIALAESDDLLLLGTGTWTSDGPGRDAMTVGYDRTRDGLQWSGHGQCPRLAPVLPHGQDWVQITAPDGGLDRTATDLTVLVMEHQCTGARDPRPFLNEPVLVEAGDRVVVTLTSPWPDGGATCPGNPTVEHVLHLSEPLGDRELLDGSTWPPTPVE